MTTPSFVRFAIALLLLAGAGSSILGCNSEPPPAEPAPAVNAAPGTSGPPSGAASDAAAAKTAK